MRSTLVGRRTGPETWPFRPFSSAPRFRSAHTAGASDGTQGGGTVSPRTADSAAPTGSQRVAAPAAQGRRAALTLLQRRDLLGGQRDADAVRLGRLALRQLLALAQRGHFELDEALTKETVTCRAARRGGRARAGRTAAAKGRVTARPRVAPARNSALAARLLRKLGNECAPDQVERPCVPWRKRVRACALQHRRPGRFAPSRSGRPCSGTLAPAPHWGVLSGMNRPALHASRVASAAAAKAVSVFVRSNPLPAPRPTRAVQGPTCPRPARRRPWPGRSWPARGRPPRCRPARRAGESRRLRARRVAGSEGRAGQGG